MFKDIRNVVKERKLQAEKDKKKINPLIVVSCAGISYQKLRLMCKEGLLLKTNINVPVLKEYLFQTQALTRAKAEQDE